MAKNMGKGIVQITAIILLVGLLCSCVSVTGRETGAKNDAATTATAAAQAGDDATTAAQPSGGDKGVVVSAPDTFPITNEKTTLKVFFVQSPFLGDMNTNATVVWLEEKTNVHIDWVLASSADAEQKAGLILASQSDLPDVFMTDVVSREQMFAYGDQGIFIDLNPYIEEHGVNTKIMFGRKPNMRSQLTSLNGNFYSLPSYSECYHCTMRQKMWINVTWLRNLNLEKPTTTEEFYDVLKAFRDNDANGNGDMDDEIPLIAVPTAFLGSPDYYLMNSFSYNSGMAYNDWLALEDGKIYLCYMKDGWKDGLKYLNRLYTEGLLDKESFIVTDEQVKMYVSDPKGNRVGAFGRNAPDTVIGSAEQKFDYEVLPPIAGPDGTRQTTLYPPTLMPYYFITKECAVPEVAFKWGDMFMRDWVADLKNKDFSWMQMWAGTEGVTWEKAKSGDIGLDGKTPAVYKDLLTYGDPSNDWLYGGNPSFVTYEQNIYTVFEPSEWNLGQVLWQATELYAPYAVDKIVPLLLFSQDEAAEVGEIKSLLQDYVQESIAKFVTGVNDIDKDWESYLSELDKIGVYKMLEIHQKAYDALYK